jgi:hypothetical protein
MQEKILTFEFNDRGLSAGEDVTDINDINKGLVLEKRGGTTNEKE